MTLIIEQILNGVLYGITLFLLAAGLTLIFGIMNVINLAHGSLYMLGAFAGTWVARETGYFWLGLPAALLSALVVGILLELVVIRHLYERNHLDQVLATFALILLFNGTIMLIAGRQPLYVDLPEYLAVPVQIFEGLSYPRFRLIILGAGLLVAFSMWLLINCTRVGMLVRAGATNRDMVRALGVDIKLLYTAVFGLGALLAGLAGFMNSPITAVQVGMGEQILISTFVVAVVGGVGSVKGAFVAGLTLGIFDTCLRAFLPGLLRELLPASEADALGLGLASMGIYLLMAAVLIFRPKGLFKGGV